MKSCTNRKGCSDFQGNSDSRTGSKAIAQVNLTTESTLKFSEEAGESAWSCPVLATAWSTAPIHPTLAQLRKQVLLSVQYHILCMFPCSLQITSGEPTAISAFQSSLFLFLEKEFIARI